MDTSHTPPIINNGEQYFSSINFVWDKVMNKSGQENATYDNITYEI
jgi:hypothetical protein